MMSNARRNRVAVHIVALVLSVAPLTLTGCASTFDALPEAAGGLPASAPKRAEEQPAYPNVYAPMAPRETRMLNSDEQKSLEQELLALRDSQFQRANPPPPAKKKVGAPPKKQPAKKQAAKRAEKKSAERKAADKPPN
jgi:hypothetical protein